MKKIAFWLYSIIKKTYILCFILILVSCSQTPLLQQWNYTNEEVTIPQLKDALYTSRLDNTAYEIEDIISLQLPDSYADVSGVPVFCNNRIFILDSKRTCVLAFDMHGQFLFKMGGLGRAYNEIFGEITAFDVAKKTGEVHIYNKAGQKIIVFDNDGNYVRRVPLNNFFPTSFVLTEDGNYIVSCSCGSTNDNHTKLLLLDKNGNTIMPFLDVDDDNNIASVGWNTTPLFSDHQDNITYLSTLADSLLLLSGDSIKSVIKMKFKDGFLSDSEIKEAKKKGEILVENSNVQFVSKAILNNRFLILEIYGHTRMDDYSHNYTCLFDKKINKMLFCSGSMNFPCIISNISTVLDDNIIFIVTTNDVDHAKAMVEDDLARLDRNGVYSNVYNVAAQSYDTISADFVTDRIKAPSILKVKLK